MSLIKHIRVANSSRTVEVDIYPCGFEDFSQWQHEIHEPYIASMGGIGSQWYWPALFVGCHLSEQSFGRQCVMFQVRVANPLGDAVPVAQVILSVPYPNPANELENCVFVWFVAAAPEAALKANKVADKFSVLAAVLDTAVQVSLGHGLEGRIALHAAAGADEAENERLAEKYRRYGLKQKTKSSRYFRFPHRPDDGRFFHFTEEASRKFTKNQDDLR